MCVNFTSICHFLCLYVTFLKPYICPSLLELYQIWRNVEFCVFVLSFLARLKKAGVFRTRSLSHASQSLLQYAMKNSFIILPWWGFVLRCGPCWPDGASLTEQGHRFLHTGHGLRGEVPHQEPVSFLPQGQRDFGPRVLQQVVDLLVEDFEERNFDGVRVLINRGKSVLDCPANIELQAVKLCALPAFFYWTFWKKSQKLSKST